MNRAPDMDTEDGNIDYLTCPHEEYEAWLDSLPNNTSVDGNVAALPDNCEEMFNKEIIGDDFMEYPAGAKVKVKVTSVAEKVYNDAFGAYQDRVYSSLSTDDLAFLVAHIRQDEAYKCAELCEEIREQVAVSVDEYSAKAASLCSRAIRTKRMGTLTQDEVY